MYCLIVILPMFISFYYSTLEWDGIGTQEFIGFKNYIKLFTDYSFLKSVINSFILTILTLLIQLPVALFLAIVLANGIKGEGFLRNVFFIPVTLSSVVIGLLWKRVYDPNFGLLNTILKFFGLSSLTRTWLGDTTIVLLAVCIPIIWQWVGYHMLIMYAGAKSIPAEIREAATIDGANELQVALKITIPLMKPVLKISFILAVIGSLKTFDIVYILTNGGPVHASEVPSTLMVSTIFKRYMYGYGSAMAIFIVLECLILTLVIQKYFKVQDITY